MIEAANWNELVNGREIVVYGTGENAYSAVKQINTEGGEVSFFISRDWQKKPVFMDKSVYGKEVLDKSKHYVIIGSFWFMKQISNELIHLGFEENADFTLSFSINMRFRDWRENGVPIGKCSYFPPSWKEVMVDADYGGVFVREDYISSIGRFTSINKTAIIHGDHSMKMLTTSDAFLPLLTGNKIDSLNKRYKESLANYNRIKIGNDVWIGANVFINASKVRTIGDGAIIGAGAVVLEDVPPYSVFLGVPGKVKKYRYTPEQIECLLRVKWWDWSEEEINENAELLYNPEMFFERFM